MNYIPKNNNPFSSRGKEEFLTLLDAVCPDVFHTNCCWLPMSVRTVICAKHRGDKVVYTPHGMFELWIMEQHYLMKKLSAILLFQRRGIKVTDIIHSTAESEKVNLIRQGWNK